jgi:hypothetical protein
LGQVKFAGLGGGQGPKVHPVTARRTTRPPGADVQPGRVLGAAADPTRLRVLAAVVLAPEPADVVHLSEAAGVSLTQVKQALPSLEAAGVIQTTAPSTEGDPRWEAVPATFGVAARLVARMRPEPDPEELGATPEQASVLRGFLAGGRLTGLPAQQSKRAVLLDFVVQRFEPGRRYHEAEVNQSLKLLWDDHATLRRALVDEGLLERAGGRYWRSGGTFDVDADPS